MDATIGAQVEIYRGRLAALVRRGLDLREALAGDAANGSALSAARLWQQDCGVVVNELSGGSKAHWLARAFSEAFLVRGTAGAAVDGVAPAAIVERLIGVLEQALASLSQEDATARIAASQAPPSRQFDFVHNPELRPVLERAYRDARHAFDAGDYDVALLTYSGVLEAIVTDALQQKGPDALQTADAHGKIADWPFETRLKVAEQSGLIGRGCARLPAVAHNYRELDEASKAAITERNARLTGQVLHVIMRDLNPGR